MSMSTTFRLVSYGPCSPIGVFIDKCLLRSKSNHTINHSWSMNNIFNLGLVAEYSCFAEWLLVQSD